MDQGKDTPCGQDNPGFPNLAAAIQALLWSYPKLCSIIVLRKIGEKPGKSSEVNKCITMLWESNKKKSASQMP